MQTLHTLITQLPGGDTLWMALMFVVVLSILVFIHEMGHFLAARSVGVRIEVFSIGFGKEIFGWNDKTGCRWKVSFIPLGGYVKMFGEESGAVVNEHEQAVSFTHKHVLARIWVVAAGPLANFLFAVVALAALFSVGEQKMLAQVGNLQPDMPAIKAGLQPGDLISQIDDTPINDWSQVVGYVSDHAAQQLLFSVVRNGAVVQLPITPQATQITTLLGEERSVGRIGVLPSGETFTQSHGVVEATVLGVQRTWEMSGMLLQSIGKMITRDIPADQIGGPIAIAEMAGKSAENGSYNLVMFMVFISINLGLLNLFPVPMLDGGHLVYYFAELVKGKPLNEKIQMAGQRLGLAVLLCLMGFAFYNDIMRVLTRMMGAE